MFVVEQVQHRLLLVDRLFAFRNRWIETERDRAEIVQHSAYRGSSHRQFGSNSHVSTVIWLYLSPIGQDRDLLFTHGDYYLPTRLRWEGGRHHDDTKTGEGEETDLWNKWEVKNRVTLSF